MAESPTECPVLETDRTHLSPQEHSLLKNLLQPGAKIETVIPEDATPEELWTTLDACVRGLSLLEARVIRLKPIIGRLLLIFEQKPSLYKQLGYDTYSDFMRFGVYEKLGLHRTSAYEGKLVARDWPQIGPDEYVKVGPKKLNVLAQAGIKGTNSNAEAWLDTAKSMRTVTELRQYMEQRQFLQVGETVGVEISFTTNRAVYAKWREMLADGRVHSVVGSKEPGKIFEAMMQEVFNEWVTKYEEAKAAEAVNRRQRVEAPEYANV